MSNVEEIRNFRDLRVAHLHNKFWTPNSVEVPDSIVVLNEDFVDVDNVVRVPEQQHHFKVYWAIKDISGVVCLPGQWNYAYIDGRFYHLTKGDSNGFIEGVEDEWFYYNVTYDDWQNDWMKNRVYLKGTIDLTGDKTIVSQNIHQMVPLLENVNNRRFLNGLQKKGEDAHTDPVFKLPETLPEKLQAKTPYTVWEREFINGYLKEWGERVKADPEVGKPNQEKLVLPYLFRMTKGGNWKNTIVKSIQYHANKGFQVYDVTHGAESDHTTQSGKFRNLLQNMLHSDNLYAVASRSNRVYVHARAVNPAMYIEEVDLSGITDITLLDTETLAQRYTLDNPAPKFNLQKFVDWICNRQEWYDSGIKEEMKNIFQDEFIKTFGQLLASGGRDDNKVFRDVELEKIQRDVVALMDSRGPTKNPEWMSWADSIFVSGNHHKNHM